MRVALLGQNRKFRVLPLLFVLTLVIISSSFAGAFVADAPNLLNNTVKTGVHGSLEGGSTASVYANNPAVNLSAGEPSEILPVSQGVEGTPSYMNQSIWLGDFNGSYLQPVYIPVYCSDIGPFNILNQTFSYDPQILSFNGTLNDVASHNVNFSYTIPKQGIMKIYGKGPFNAEYSQTVLYYLVFNSVIKNQTITSVLLDFSATGSLNVSIASQATVRLARGWTNLGPKNFSSYDPYTQSNASGEVFLAGTVPAIGYSPYNLSILYAASGRGGPWQGNLYQGESVNGFGGIFKSTDYGKSWYPVDNGLNSTEVNAIAVNPQNPNMVVIATGGIASIVGGGIYKTTNGGKSWQETYGLGGNFITFYEGKLYAASYHAILASSDFGSSWKVVHYFPDIVTTMDVSDGGNTIFVGLYQGGQYGQVSISKSTNAGLNFYSVLNETGYYSVSQIQTDPSNLSRMMALIEHAYMVYPNLFSSSDAGLTWNAINDSKAGINYSIFYGSGFQNGYVAEVPQAFSYDPMNGSVIYVAGPSGTYKSTDGGSHYELLVTGGTPNDSQGSGGDMRMISVDPINDSIIFIGSDQGLSVSKDAGYTWTLLNNRSASMIYTVAASGSYVFTTVQDWSPEFSNDYGKGWYSAQGSEEGWASVDPYNNLTVIISGPTVVSNDGGRTFTYLNSNFGYGYSGYTQKNVVGIAYAKNGTIYIVGKEGIYRSLDNAATWNVIRGSPKMMETIAIDPMSQSVLYASGYTNDSSWGTYRSTDGGSTWSKINNIVFSSLAVDPSDDSILAGMEYNDYAGKLVISYDRGDSFHSLNFTTVDLFVASPQVFFYQHNGSTFLIYTTDQGIYASTDLGAGWMNLTYNIPTSVVSDLFISDNGSAYLSTYGMGVWYDPDLFVANYSLNKPMLAGYLPSSDYLVINGIRTNGNGFFTSFLRGGNNTIYIGSLGSNVSLMAVPGKIYFENFSSVSSLLTVEADGLTYGAHFSLSIGGNSFYVENGSTIQTGIQTYDFSVGNIATDYSIYSPSPQHGEINGSSLISTLHIAFSVKAESSFSNLSGRLTGGPFWTTSIAYNEGEIMYTGGGNIAVLNVSSRDVSVFQFPSPNGLVNSVTAYGNGFLIGGSSSPNRAGIYYFDISTRIFTNYTSFLPTSWNGSFSAISALFGINSSAFGFIGGGIDSVYFGLIDNGKFVDLAQYLPSSLVPTNGGSYRYSGAYIASVRGIVISSGSYIGIFYLDSRIFSDISQLMPTSFYVGTLGNVWSPSSDFISSNSSTAMIIGRTDLGPMEVLYNPTRGMSDLSKIFPQSEYADAVTWSGSEFILSGYSAGNSTPSVFIYNASKGSLTEVGTGYFGNLSMVDSTILAGNSLYFTTFNSKPIPNTVYVADYSYYGTIRLTATGSLNLKINALSTIEINNETYYAMNATISEFTGNYTLTVSSPGFVSYASTVDLLPFETLYLNVTLAPKSYGITFIENGLANGTSWSVTLNGTTESSTGNITFLEPNGTYTFQILPASGLTASPSSGTISVTGKNVSETAHFTPSALRVYSVTFYQTGLPEGISWSVALNGTTNTSVPSISFSVPNGTYSYSVASKPGYNETPSSGSVTVNGHNVSLQVIFMRNNDGYFVPTVIPEVASLYVDGTLYQRAGILIGLPAGNGNGSVEEFFNISLPPGTYQVKVTAPGYRNYTTTITIASPLTSLHPDYILEKISKPPSSLLLEVAVIAVVIVVIAAITTVILLRKRKR